jgi:hypothetical protein
MPDLRRRDAVAWALVAAAAVLLAYWLTWYFSGPSLLASSDRPAYDVIITVVASVATLRWAWRRRKILA